MFSMKYQIKKVDPFRLLSIYGYEAVGVGHNMYALIELDVTDLRQDLRRRRRVGEKVSFFGYLLSAIALTLDENRELNHIRRGKRTYHFEEVDIDIPIELELEEVSVPRKYIVRNAARKSAEEISREIEQAKENWRLTGLAGEDDRWARFWIGFASWSPKWVFTCIARHFSKNPFFVKKGFGTTYVSSVGGFSDINGYMVPFFAGRNRPLAFAIGNVNRKPAVIGSEIMVREILNMTVAINHDLVDGAPAARFINRLKHRIEGKFE